MLMLAGLAAGCDAPATIEDGASHRADDAPEVQFGRRLSSGGRIDVPIKNSKSFRAVAIRTTQTVDPLEVSIVLPSGRGRVEVAIAAHQDVYGVIKLPNPSAIETIQVRGLPPDCEVDVTATSAEEFASALQFFVSLRGFMFEGNDPESAEPIFALDLGQIRLERGPVNLVTIRFRDPIELDGAIVTDRDGKPTRLKLRSVEPEKRIWTFAPDPTDVIMSVAHLRIYSKQGVRRLGEVECTVEGYTAPIRAPFSSRPRAPALAPSPPSSM
jgi:hypothetical protein